MENISIKLINLNGPHGIAINRMTAPDFTSSLLPKSHGSGNQEKGTSTIDGRNPAPVGILQISYTKFTHSIQAR